MNTCTIAQAWAPGLIWDGEYFVRPNLVMLVSEDHALPVGTQLTAHPLSPIQLSDWLPQAFAVNGAPKRLCFQDPNWEAALRFRYPEIELRIRPNSPAWRHLYREQTAATPEHVSHCVLQVAGERRALELYQQAHRFFEAQPWRQLNDDLVFRYTTETHEYGVTLGGSTKAADQGIYVFDSVNQIVKGNGQVSATVSAMHTWGIHPNDLNFMDLHSLKPSYKYSAFNSWKQPMNKRVLQDLYWLLRTLPKFCQSQDSIFEGKRSLEMTGLTPLRFDGQPRWLCMN